MTTPLKSQGGTEEKKVFVHARTIKALKEEIRRLRDELASLKRGEAICVKCGLRIDGEGSGKSVEF